MYLFVGPTGYGVNIDLFTRAGEVLLLPPVRRGDIDRLRSSMKATTICICDGEFHQYPAVGHAEIRDAILAGWEVWGICSMGAIRAAEMECYGMRGYGDVFEEYRSNADFTDDEVTQLHEGSKPFAPLSEPLVHFRSLCSSAVDMGVLSDQQAVAICSALAAMWYGYRTLETFLEIAREIAPASYLQLARSAECIDTFRTKTKDLVSFLSMRPWDSKQ